MKIHVEHFDLQFVVVSKRLMTVLSHTLLQEYFTSAQMTRYRLMAIPWLESTMTRPTTVKLNSQTRKVCTRTLQGWQTVLAVVCEVHQC